MCKVTDCQRKPVAKGLCAKHYMRVRRCGNPNTIRKRGPRSVFGDVDLGISKRSRVRFKAAIDALHVLEQMGVENATATAFEMAKRPRSRLGLNISAMVRAADDMRQRMLSERAASVRRYQFRPDG
jgi:hypothetical protein